MIVNEHAHGLPDPEDSCEGSGFEYKITPSSGSHPLPFSSLAQVPFLFWPGLPSYTAGSGQ